MKFLTFSYSYMARCLVAPVLLMSQSAAFSQSTTLVPSSTPTATIELNYHSVFSQYQGFQDQAVSAWLQNNATVATIGGWRVYAKEAFLPNAQPAAIHVPSHLHNEGKP